MDSFVHFLTDNAFSSLAKSGGFAVMLFWLLRATIKDREDQRRHDARIVVVLIKAVLESVWYLTELMTRHDAQVRGLNTALGDTQEERDREAVRIYSQLLANMTDVRRRIDQLLNEEVS